MFKSIMTSMSICLQGTPFERKPRKNSATPVEEENWFYKLEQENPPYLLVADEFKVKNDLLTKLHTRDAHLMEDLTASRRGRAKWLPDFYEQTYDGPKKQPNPGIEAYCRAFGLTNSKEPRLS